MNRRQDISKGIDWATVGIYFLLVAIGWVAIYANTRIETKSFFDISQNYVRQFIWIGTSFILAFMVLLTDAKFFTTFSYYIYGVVMLLLIGVLFIGSVVNGSKSWYEIGSFQLQPAELGKFAAALAVAKYLSALNLDTRTRRNQMIAAALAFFPAALILLQGDTGSALVFGAFFFVLFRFGMPGWILIAGVYVLVLFIFALLIDKFLLIGILFVLAAAVIALLFRRIKNIIQLLILVGGIWLASCLFVLATDYVFNNILEPHQQERIMVMLGKDVKTGADYNVKQSKIAIGSGGLWGKGPMKGTFTKGDFVPEQSTDFIFCTIGEEYGFAGSTFLMLVYLFLLWRLLMMAERQRSKFSRIYAYGVACILFFHVMINVGMTIGLAPVIGIPLPFISYGGSSLWSFTILLFIMIKLDADRLSILR